MITNVALTVEVFGLPAAQGSKRHVGGGRMIESSKAVGPWREAVKYAARTALAEDAAFFPITAAVRVEVQFWFPRPKHHYRTGQHSAELRANAPAVHFTKPDIDKLLRSTLDGLTEAGVWRDDAQVAAVRMTKTYTDKREDLAPGASIRVWPL